MAFSKRAYLVILLGVLTVVPFSHATELRPKTKAAFDRYIQLTEARIKAESEPGKPFLSIDAMPEAQRNAVLARLKNGEVVITRERTLDKGKEIEVPDGMIHHWMGIVFIPGTTLKKTLALQQDYDHHAEYYSPRVTLSKLISRNGNDFKIYYRVNHLPAVARVPRRGRQVGSVSDLLLRSPSGAQAGTPRCGTGNAGRPARRSWSAG